MSTAPRLAAARPADAVLSEEGADDPVRLRADRVLIVDPLDVGTKDRRAWSYLPGQRRVKVAPDFSFDTPNPGTAGGGVTFLVDHVG